MHYSIPINTGAKISTCLVFSDASDTGYEGFMVERGCYRPMEIGLQKGGPKGPHGGSLGQ